MTSHLPTLGTFSYCSPPDSKSLWFYCQGGSGWDSQRLAGDMGQRILRVDEFTTHGGRPKEEGKSSTRWDSSLPPRLKLSQVKESHIFSGAEVEWLFLWCWLKVKIWMTNAPVEFFAVGWGLQEKKGCLHTLLIQVLKEKPIQCLNISSNGKSICLKP